MYQTKFGSKSRSEATESGSINWHKHSVCDVREGRKERRVNHGKIVLFSKCVHLFFSPNEWELSRNAPCWQFAEGAFRKVLPYLVFSHLFDTDQCMTHLRSALFATGQTTDDCFYFTALILSAYKISFNSWARTSPVLRKCWPVELVLKHSQYRLNLCPSRTFGRKY
ncbi:uncharacterized protein H6S33_007508 [Morchella sextelata]|uniref:uncharacterized protein n=1 Tax=Morchella sextelata TaxID=1174677 RepID=UPI001D048084|nr:uncharacterized protein H6S33_007508 [Morchella sextelata]KAH0603849.1 hypothetical protein H6S33_007508 [Morchella sextelata]